MVGARGRARRSTARVDLARARAREATEGASRVRWARKICSHRGARRAAREGVGARVGARAFGGVVNDRDGSDARARSDAIRYGFG